MDRWHEQQARLYMAQAQQQSLMQRVIYTSSTFFGGVCGYGTNLLYSGMGQMQIDPYGCAGTMQTHLGTPALAPPAPLEPEEIAWLKGRIADVLWPQKISSGGRAL